VSAPTSGFRYLPPGGRSLRNWFGRWGTAGGDIRGLWNGIIPVALVDRFRDDTEGSLYGMTMTANVAANQHASFAMGSVVDDWELHQLQVGWFFPGALSTTVWNHMVYTPLSGFNPVPTPAPVGQFVPGLVTNFAFTFGSVFGVAGHNPSLPTPFGFFPFTTKSASSLAPVGSTNFQAGPAHRFDPPIRIFRSVTLGVITVETVSNAVDMTMTALYTIRPRTTDGPAVAP
jgi:hypothetical protein